MKKNTVIIILTIAVAALLCVIIGMTVSRRSEMEKINLQFKSCYNMFIAEARNGNISGDLQNPNRYDIETAKYAYELNDLYYYTSYSDNTALLNIITLLDQAVGNYRYYPDFSFADMPQQTYDMLVELSLHFDDEQLSQLTLSSLQAEMHIN